MMLEGDEKQGVNLCLDLCTYQSFAPPTPMRANERHNEGIRQKNSAPGVGALIYACNKRLRNLMDGGLIGGGLDLQICPRVGGLDLEFGQIPSYVPSLPARG